MRHCSALLVAIGIAGMVLASCGSEQSKYQFKTAQGGLNYYNSFLAELKTAKSNDMADIARDIAAWQEMEDSVLAVISRDTAAFKAPHSFPHDIVNTLHNSVREEFLNRAMAKQRSLQDVLTLRLNTNRLSGDKQIGEAVATAAPFFLSLDSVSIYNDSCDQLISRYQTYLRNVERAGIHDKNDLLFFMREEDRLFRSFVTHLSETDGMSATNITQTTERIYAQLPKLVADSIISHDGLFIYMTMRTNRRLLINAQGCLVDIKASKVKTADQRRAYLLMLLQPFTAISDIGLAMLTDEQKATFAQVAKEASSVLVRLAGQDKAERERIASFPDLMVKIYISSL